LLKAAEWGKHCNRPGKDKDHNRANRSRQIGIDLFHANLCTAVALAKKADNKAQINQFMRCELLERPSAFNQSERNNSKQQRTHFLPR